MGAFNLFSHIQHPFKKERPPILIPASGEGECPRKERMKKPIPMDII
jgi:hypothetical protein